MARVNSVHLLGNLTRDPEMSFTPNGKALCKFSVAVQRFGKDNGADFFKVTCWEKTADAVGNNLNKGSRVYIQGELSFRQWDTDDGQKRSAVEVTARDVQFLTPKSEAVDEDIPF